MVELSHKQECIKGYFDNLNKMNSYFGYDVSKLKKKERKYLRYKFACVDSHPNCDKITDNKSLADFEWCQVKCQYSYENGLVPILGVNFG